MYGVLGLHTGERLNLISGCMSRKSAVAAVTQCNHPVGLSDFLQSRYVGETGHLAVK